MEKGMEILKLDNVLYSTNTNSVSTEDTCVTSVKALDNTSVLAAVLTFMATIILFGCGGNMLVILAVSQTKKLQTASNLFVANLSLCDLLFVSLVLPVNMYTYLEGGWKFHINICRAVGFLGYTLTGTTIMTITAIAWNRYKLVVDSKMYHVIFRRRNMALMLAATWLIPAAFLQPAVLEAWGHFGFIPKLSTCNLGLDSSSQKFKIFLLIVRAAIPCGLIIYFYSTIYLTTRASRLRLQQRHTSASSNGTRNNNSNNNSTSNSNSGDDWDSSEPLRSSAEQHSNQREMRLTRMMIGIFLVFVISYFPCTVSSAIDMSNLLSKTFHMFCQTSIFLGSAINPLLYGFMNGQFRKAYYNIITCTMLHRYCYSRTFFRKRADTDGSAEKAKSRKCDSASYKALPSTNKDRTESNDFPSPKHMSSKVGSPMSSSSKTQVDSLNRVFVTDLKNSTV
ncbi:G-protein coupled receptor moody [Plakobranchus ocellatus]|uniref:G-protein coupled receptor moody n=1 Tax=Plakobranchus ocellatus TaxID=259542 RepID=A0AAV3ZFC9_9GAST|nr:G-protein coupled receptor moody [Plakobranchus ocellatus]